MSCLQIATNLAPPQDVQRQLPWGEERPFLADEAEAGVMSLQSVVQDGDPEIPNMDSVASSRTRLVMLINIAI